jgi:predicted HTH domain antitoxin
MSKMAALQIEMPDDLSSEEARLLLAVKLYELSRVSLGQAASIAGISKRAFIEALGSYQIPVFRYSAEELQSEIDV